MNEIFSGSPLNLSSWRNYFSLHPLIKKLAGQTAIYGLSSIVGRFLNYLLVPLHTRIFAPQEFGVVSEFYAYAAFLNIVFTYGMETAFFRFCNLKEDKRRVYATAINSLLISSLILSGLLYLFSENIAAWVHHEEHAEYIRWFALILGLDALVAIPFAYLRLENRPLRFAFFKIANIGVNVLCNVLLLLVIPWFISRNPAGGLQDFIRSWYKPEVGVGFVFISGLIASGVTVFMLYRYFRISWKDFDGGLWKKMITYALPLILVGLAGMVDEKISIILLKYRLPVTEEQAMYEVGIFAACYKLSIIMTLFIQAYRMAAEPFFFNESTKENARLTYARTMNFFIIFCCCIFLFVAFFLDLFKVVFIGKQFYEGVKIVPILLLANFFLGIYYNLTIWYKLTNRTSTGALVALYGALLTIILNWWWIPIFGYMGSAWTTFTVYGTMVIISYLLGHRFYPVPYDLRRFFIYLAIAVAFYLLHSFLKGFVPDSLWILNYVFGVMLLFAFIGIAYFIEKGKVGWLKPV